MTAHEWIDAFAARLGVPAPDDATTDALLEVAAEAAHGSERVAAPIACYLVGVAGTTTAGALAAAQAVSSGG